jgi:hypothetical protein
MRRVWRLEPSLCVKPTLLTSPLLFPSHLLSFLTPSWHLYNLILYQAFILCSYSFWHISFMFHHCHLFAFIWNFALKFGGPIIVTCILHHYITVLHYILQWLFQVIHFNLGFHSFLFVCMSFGIIYSTLSLIFWFVNYGFFY